MKEEEKKDRIDDLFAHFEGQWDTDEPTLGHHNRFMEKLDGKSKNKSVFGWAQKLTAVAAAIVIVLGLYFVFNTTAAVNNKMSAKNEQTQEYFSTVINKELAKLHKEDSPETKRVIADALKRMEELEKDYNKLQAELGEYGENKKIIHAMITNLQTRVSFLEDVMTQVENIKKIKDNYHENNG